MRGGNEAASQREQLQANVPFLDDILIKENEGFLRVLLNYLIVDFSAGGEAKNLASFQTLENGWLGP